jgi:hypothetical protein
MTTTFHEFATRFQRIEAYSESIKFTPAEIQSIEEVYQIKLPSDFKEFALSYGAISTPNLDRLILDKMIELYSVQNFLSSESINLRKNTLSASVLKGEYMPFAEDWFGDMFAFKISDLKTLKPTSPIYFYTYDYDTITKISDGFTIWLEEFNKIPK